MNFCWSKSFGSLDIPCPCFSGYNNEEALLTLALINVDVGADTSCALAGAFVGGCVDTSASFGAVDSDAFALFFSSFIFPCWNATRSANS